MKATVLLGAPLVATLLLLACAEEPGSSSEDFTESDLDNPNECQPTDDSSCDEQDTMRTSTTADNEVARYIGTFKLSAQSGSHKSPICELTLEVSSKYDDTLDANRLSGRNYRLVTCDSSAEERGTYKILEHSYSHLRYIEFKSEKGETRKYGLGDNSGVAEFQLQNWFYPEGAGEDGRDPVAEFDSWGFSRTPFWCNATADCDGQYLGCFAKSPRPKDGLMDCENGPPWACTNNVCDGVLAK